MSVLELTEVGAKLWEAFQARSLLPAERNPIIGRWRRAQRLGVAPDGSPQSGEPMRGAGLTERRDAAAPLLMSAEAVLAPAEAIFSRAHYALLLSDADGVVLHSRGGGEFESTARQLRLIEGGRWSEEVQGTNAIGTALVERCPVSVFGHAHYVRTNHALVCYASPIHDPYGRLLGALDATSFAAAAHPAIQLAVMHGALTIQATLRRQAWSAAGAGLLGPLLNRCTSPVLIVEWPGVVHAANAAAERDLQMPLAGTDLESICGLSWAQLRESCDASAQTIEAPGWAGDPRPRTLTLRPVQGEAGLLLGVLLFVEPARAAAVRGKAAQPDDKANRFAPLLGTDPVLTRTRELAARIAPSKLPVLLLAETGTGKGLLAKAIHNASLRAKGPFVDISCGALSPQLLESELFGYAPGSFTGAKRAGHEGLIHHAAGGTLFLDEVAEMSPSLQAMLLKVLEEGTYYPVGDPRPRTADVRLICATCRDLEGMVSAGTFRRDLYYRIRGATLTLPPLRERQDLIELAVGLIAKLTHEQTGPGATPPVLSAQAARVLRQHTWPGNVRELRMAVQFALTLAQSEVIGLDDLPDDLQRLASEPAPSAPAALASSRMQTLSRVLSQTAGNISEAARQLGVARSTVYRMMQKHGLGPGGKPDDAG